MPGRAIALLLAGLVLAPPLAAQGTVVNLQGLSFGWFAANTGGAVIVTPTGDRSREGAVVLVSAGGGAAATFQISGGTPNGSCSVSLPPGGEVVLTGPGGATMVVDSFTSTAANPVQLNAAGGAFLGLGATLRVGNGQAPGAYHGILPIEVSFN